ncbi:hypothetical protein BMD20_03290 [Burkholderia multivorans]|jgi:hypothetical protein|nr:hypothetical protein BMD22_26140 [Burkholderia multivorans]KHS19500.1 hypothetical protein BMD20_03290 [Burkholderia multivorans]MBR7923761.1 hypothetical protein [Burkholderia multivorans]MBR8102996.1 hypothetical protein [Burkholderia multivorans]MBR8340116.1 hypothetical protein [Burkholderia multivorans]
MRSAGARMHNPTDGSIYLVRAARTQNARTDLTVTIGALIAFAFVIGIMSAVQRSTDGMLAVFAWRAAATLGLYGLSTVLRSLFGFVMWPDIRRFKHPAGRREVGAAKAALTLAPEEATRIRFL